MIKSLYKQGSDLWFSEKLARITGTRFDLLMQGENTKGYNELIANIAGEMITGEMEETFKNKLMEEAQKMEHEARPHLSDVIGEMEEVGFMTREEDEDYHEWVGLSPDSLLIGQRGYVEIKCPLMKTHLSYFRRGGENDYRWQLQGGLWVMQQEYDFVYFCSYYPGLKPYIKKIEPDESDFKKIDERMPVTIERVQELMKNYDTSDEYES